MKKILLFLVILIRLAPANSQTYADLEFEKVFNVEGDRIALSVTETGIGIPEEEIIRLAGDPGNHCF